MHEEPELTTESVEAALREVPYPGLTRDLTSLGMIQHVSACAGHARVRVAVKTADASIPGRIERAIVEKLRAIGAEGVTVDIVEPEPRQMATSHGTPDPWADRARLGAARHVIAVGAGKGGVGKSTVAVNVALALAAEGLRTALLDADIYGPSLPILLGIEDGASRIRLSPEKHIIPLAAHGIPLVSFGFFVGEGSPAIWRGPMVSKAVKQFVRGVAWPELDVLVVDLPPGTGDIPLSLAQAVELSGAVVVTQPARVAAAEARKAAQMFATLEVPLLGIVENMSGAFGRGAGNDIVRELGTRLLGEIPFDTEIVREGDDGTPTVVARAGSASALAFGAVAREVASALGWSHREAVA